MDDSRARNGGSGATCAQRGRARGQARDLRDRRRGARGRRAPRPGISRPAGGRADRHCRRNLGGDRDPGSHPVARLPLPERETPPRRGGSRGGSTPPISTTGIPTIRSQTSPIPLRASNPFRSSWLCSDTGGPWTISLARSKSTDWSFPAASRQCRRRSSCAPGPRTTSRQRRSALPSPSTTTCGGSVRLLPSSATFGSRER